MEAVLIFDDIVDTNVVFSDPSMNGALAEANTFSLLVRAFETTGIPSANLTVFLQTSPDGANWAYVQSLTGDGGMTIALGDETVLSLAFYGIAPIGGYFLSGFIRLGFFAGFPGNSPRTHVQAWFTDRDDRF